MPWNRTQNARSLNSNSQEYQLYPGYYSQVIVKPGFHSGIQGCCDPINLNVTPTLPHPYGFYPTPTPTPTISQHGGGGDVRFSDTVYSGDLVELRSDQRDQNAHLVLQRAPTHSQILLDAPTSPDRTNLSKLRLENLEGYGPIRYGEQIYLKHNAMIDNKNQIRFIKYGERLQSHQNGTIYALFKAIKRNKYDSQAYLKYGEPFLLACGDQEGDKIYLKMEDDHSLSAEATADQATIFVLTLKHPVSETSLHIGPDETLYP